MSPAISTACGTQALRRAVTIVRPLEFLCHPRESGGPGATTRRFPWIPAFAGMTKSGCSCVMHPALDKAELDRGQPDDDRHQDDRLRRRAAEIEADDAVVPDLVDEDLGRLRRTALGHVVDDPERVEKRIDDVDDEQEKAGRRQERKDDRPEPPARAGAVDRRGFDERQWDRLEPGQEKQEIIADL